MQLSMLQIHFFCPKLYKLLVGNPLSQAPRDYGVRNQLKKGPKRLLSKRGRISARIEGPAEIRSVSVTPNPVQGFPSILSFRLHNQ